MEKAAQELVQTVVSMIARELRESLDVTRLEGGYQSGAYLLRNESGLLLVLKVSEGTRRLQQLERVRPVVSTMRARGYPMPDLLLIGTLEERATYSVREFVLGEPMTSLNDQTVQLVLDLLDMQASVNLETDQDWSRWMRKVLSGAEENYPEALRSYPETSKLWEEIQSLVGHREPPDLPTTDMVHGDFRPGNLVLHQGSVSGVIDYEYAGKGHRAIDLGTMLADEMVANHDSEVYNQLWRKGVGMVGEEVLLLILLYHAVEMMVWFITKGDERRLRGQVAQATAILKRL